MDYKNGTLVFETLLKDHYFFQYVDDYIQSKILKTRTFESKHIPSLLFIISNLLKNDKKYNKIMKRIKNNNDFNNLYYHIRDYIKNKIYEIINVNELVCKFDVNDFVLTYDICLKLILL